MMKSCHITPCWFGYRWGFFTPTTKVKHIDFRFFQNTTINNSKVGILLNTSFSNNESHFKVVGKISPLIAREQMQLNLPPGMCGKEAVTVVCNFSLLSTSDHYNSINANQPSKTVPLFTSREEWRGFGFHCALLDQSTEDFFSLTFNSRNSNIYSRKTLITGMKISCHAWGKPVKKRPARATYPERKGAWWKLGRSQTPHISRTLQLILEVGKWEKSGWFQMNRGTTVQIVQTARPWANRTRHLW